MPPPADPSVTISHPDRVVFPGTGITKGDLADYYRQIAPQILATLAGRPLSLVRCPEGIAGECFFQKHATGNLGQQVGSVSILEKNGKRADYLCINDARSLLACVQMGAIEFHAWGSHASHLEQPDRMVFDLDPDPGLGFAEVSRAAQEIKCRLADRGLASFAMLTGGKGIHVIVPLRPERGWDEVTAFARGFAQEMAAAEPGRFVATMSKARRKGRIFIDWLRNQRGSTAIAPYSVRTREGAPVAAPVDWSELAEFETAAAFHLPDRERLIDRARHSALAGWGQASQNLPRA